MSVYKTEVSHPELKSSITPIHFLNFCPEMRIFQISYNNFPLETRIFHIPNELPIEPLLKTAYSVLSTHHVT